MSNSATAGLESPATDESIEQLDDRDVCALTEYQSVLPADGDGLFTVVSQSGNSYTVDRREERCSCPDSVHHQPDGGCKHVRRVEYAIGNRSIPSWVDRDAVDSQLGIHVDSSPTEEEQSTAITDGGTETVKHGSESDECEDCIDGVAPCFDCYRNGKSFP